MRYSVEVEAGYFAREAVRSRFEYLCSRERVAYRIEEDKGLLGSIFYFEWEASPTQAEPILLWVESMKGGPP